MAGVITSVLYLPDKLVPQDMPLKINNILRLNHKFDRYILILGIMHGQMKA